MTSGQEPAGGDVPFDTSTPHVARVYDFWLGGTDNFQADRAVAQRVAPQSRVVYVDNDPIVPCHAQALLTSSPEGATDYLDADLRATGTILERAAGILDFGQPVAVMLLGIPVWCRCTGGGPEPGTWATTVSWPFMPG